jgi:hypothetical protein
MHSALVFALVLLFGLVIAQQHGESGFQSHGPQQNNNWNGPQRPPFGGRPPFPPQPPRPSQNFFVGTFLSNPEYDSQTNMYNVYSSSGFQVGMLNQNVTVQIVRNGTASPITYQVTENVSTNVAGLITNTTLIQFIFQVGIPNNSTTYYGGVAAQVLATFNGPSALSFNYTLSGGQTARVVYNFDGQSPFGKGGRGRRLTAKYIIPGVRVPGQRSFGRQIA